MTGVVATRWFVRPGDALTAVSNTGQESTVQRICATIVETSRSGAARVTIVRRRPPVEKYVSAKADSSCASKPFHEV